MAKVRVIRGRYFLDYRDATGRRHIERADDGKSKRRADELLKQAIADAQTGYLRADGRRVRLRDYALEWLERRRPDLTADTWRSYRAHINRHILDPEIGLGHLALSQITRQRILRFKADLLATRTGQRDERGRRTATSPHTFNRILQRLDQLLEDAVKDGLILANPARQVEKLAQPREEMDHLTADELRRLLDAAAAIGPWLHAAVLTAALTGLRQGEQRALRWEQVDLDRLELRVPTGRHRDRRVRAVTISPALAAELRRWRLASGNPSGTALVFPGRDAKGKPRPLSGQFLLHQLRRALRAADLRESLRWHDLRHTYASLLFAGGANVKWISLQLGHSSIQITLDRYTHLMPGAGADDLLRLDEAVLGAEKPVRAQR